MQPIGPGATGAAVQDVQRRLVALGHGITDPAGSFGEQTERAVRMFQQARRLTADGVVGHDTWTALVDAGHELGDRLLYQTLPPLRGDDVRELQRALSRLGFDTGSADGILGPETGAALRDFQHNIGVVVDGIAGPATIAQLRSLWRRHQASTSFEVLERHGPAGPAGGLVGLRVIIDPAGGPGRPGGTVTAEDGSSLPEHEVTLDIARRLRGMLAANGAHPLLTRASTATPSASDRARLANETEADVILSIACASLDQPDARGVAAHYFGDGDVASDRGKRLAELAVDAVVDATGTLDLQAHASTSAILRESRAPAAVVEVGYVTNPDEGARLATPGHRHAIAAALAAAVQAWVTPVDHP